MLTKQILVLLALGIIAHNSFFSQDDVKSEKRLQITSFSFYPGLISSQDRFASLDDFRKIVPESKLLQSDFSDFTRSSGYGRTANSALTIAMGLQWREGKKPSNSQLRVGLTYFSSSNLNAFYYKENRYAYDTLTSSQSGKEYYVDSINSKSYSMNSKSEQIYLDVSYLFSTNPEARWSLFTGLGVSAGMSINAQASIYYSDFSRIEPSQGSDYPNSGYGTQYSINGNIEWVDTKNVFGYFAYIPMGVDFRIGKKREFWQRTHLFYELRPSLRYTRIPDLTTQYTAGLQQGIGIRVAW